MHTPQQFQSRLSSNSRINKVTWLIFYSRMITTSSSAVPNSRSLKYKTEYSTRSQSVVDRMNEILRSFSNNPSTSDFAVIHEIWPRFPTLNIINFDSISLPQHSILAGVDVQTREVLRRLSDKSDLIWSDFKNIPSHNLINITKGPEYSVTREFMNSMQVDLDFSNCLKSFCFADQIVTSCVVLLLNGPLFSYAHIEVVGGASYALLHTGLKIWCTATSTFSSRLLERCCNNANNFIDLNQRVPRDKEASYLRFTVQRPEDLLYIPSLRPHAFLTIDTGKPTFSSGWDASTIAGSSILSRTLNEYNIGLRRGTWQKSLRTQGKFELRNWVFSPTVGPQASTEQIQQNWFHWEKHCPHFLANLTIQQLYSPLLFKFFIKTVLFVISFSS